MGDRPIPATGSTAYIKKINSLASMKAREMPNKSRLASHSFIADLFGAQPSCELPAVVRHAVCAECGKSFGTELGMGRPAKFCTVACRSKHRRGQQRAWRGAAATDGHETPRSCAFCGGALPPRSPGPGRDRQFCRRACFRAFQRGERPPDQTMIFPLPLDQRKEPT